MQGSLELFETLGISLGLGLLVGLQRERADSRLAGLRTFPLITVFGTISGLLANQWGGWLLAAGFLSVMGLAIVGNLHKLQLGELGGGLTTEIAMLLMYSVGAYLALGPWEVGIAVGAGAAVLLQFKPELHGIARRLTDEDVRGIMQFVLITFIVLPILPNQTYGPLGVLNPFQIWLMVVLIVGIGTAAYVSYKFLGRDRGIMLGGILGGAISSTATTVTYARQTVADSSSLPMAALVITIASCALYGRILIELLATSPTLFWTALLPVLLLAVLTGLAILLHWRRRQQNGTLYVDQRNPADLRVAVMFGLLYAAVLWLMAAAKSYVGVSSLFTIAGLSGLTDLDAVTLSTARLVDASHVDPALGCRLIMTAILSNLLFKIGAARVFGGAALARRLCGMFAPTILAAAALAAFAEWLEPLFHWLPVATQ